MIRFASLGSGSRGNATLIESGSTKVLLDCGFSVKETERRLLRLGCEANSLNGIAVTHEHSDHVNGVARLSRKYNIPVWLTVGTRTGARDSKFSSTHLIKADSSFAIGDLNLHPFPVPHDAREPCQFVFSDGAHRLGILSDLGAPTPHIIDCLQDLDALVLECNYDHHMLMNGAYPYRLKQRVAGDYGHLDNRQSQAILGRLDLSKLQHLLGGHVSEKNNLKEHAHSALCSGADCEPEWVTVACQDDGFDWRCVG